MELDPSLNTPPPIDRKLIVLWVSVVICMIFFGWLNFAINSRLTPSEQFAEQFPITETTCLLPLAELEENTTP